MRASGRAERLLRFVDGRHVRWSCRSTTPRRCPRARSISAAWDRLREMLETMAFEFGADEIVLQDLIADPADRQHS